MTQAVSQTGSFTCPSADKVEIIGLHPSWLDDELIEKLRLHLDPAIDRSRKRISWDEILQKTRAFNMQLWISMCLDEMIGAAVTHVVRWGTGRKSLELILAGGKFNMHRNTEPTMKALEEFAANTGCDTVMVTGRKGWGRALPAGYEFSHAVFEKEL